MKILLVSLYGRGGMAHYTSQIANALSYGNEITIIVPTHIEKKYFHGNISLKLIKAPYSLVGSALQSINIFELRSMINYIDDYNPDVIHFVNDHPWNNLILLKFKYKYKMVLTCHDPNPHLGERNKFILKLFKLSTSHQLTRVDRIIVHGNNMVEELKKQNISSKKIDVVPHGDYQFFTNYSPSIDETDNSILFFGRIKPYKGIEYLIQAEPLISKVLTEYKIVIAGEGDISKYSKYIENDGKFEIINRYIDDFEVSLLFNKCKIVVLPYIDASQSGIVPIAYAFKKPVVATNVGSLPEIVDNEVTGFLVPPKDSKALAVAIIKLFMNDKLGVKMGENGYLKMKNELSWDNIADKTIEVYAKS
jgi:alpha-maltose-1-phosphate synthase